jgi:VWFA-related protein
MYIVIDLYNALGLDFGVLDRVSPSHVGAENSRARIGSVGRFSRLFLILLLPLSAALAQDTTPPQLQPRTTAPAKVPEPSGADRQITLDVQVTDKSGAPVRGLQKQDFTVLDDKQPQNIISFHAVDGHAADAHVGAGGADSTIDPVEIVLVIDAVNTSFQTIANERDQITKFLLRNDGKLAKPMSLIVFSDGGTDVQNASSSDGNVLAKLLDEKEIGLRSINRSQGFYGAEERFQISLKTMSSLAAYEGARPGRKLMIWISPGWPLFAGPHTQLSTKDSQRLFNSIVTTSNDFRRARVTIYSIDPLGMTDFVRNKYYEEFVKGVTSSSGAWFGNVGLQVLAIQTGGRVLNSTNDITSAIADCVTDADTFYVLSFDAARADRPNEFHAIGITIDKPGTKARTRTGYYAQP